ncbi:carboxylesterase from carbohydrate esterase [Talaromyces proteolyticus]|uniref:Carboxylic ester hydrolase n=1 Tax=Talaromyces proteolyticus TaxID=1131652 RepID=A0AAD4Q274_9EURO|nr:carboxylesterase from carbohydrate esterase [Talaromyces proteolyticus]KAH8703382.1 carboxylesterase from carbohydrate esterase [Talaromyces proteolyticus]
MPYSSTLPICENISETLYTVNAGNPLNLTSTLGHALNYTSFWVASSKGPCAVTDIYGNVKISNCNLSLPALCTQSAPFANSTYTDTTSKYQVTVNTGNQAITGFRDRRTFRFQGIRYAAQPERFTYSQVYNETAALSALSYGQSCLQAGTTGIAGGEDCLFLNIYTPHLPSNGSDSTNLKPVLFFIHGGGFVSGSGADPEYDGGNMASRGDVVVVSINYRLGIFGFLALDDGITNGNFGIADQITALDWVRANIAAFGGDANLITLIGQSAGAASVRQLLTSPPAVGKFTGAIVQSDPLGLGEFYNYMSIPTIEEEVVAIVDPVLESTGCANATSQVSCLRSVSADELLITNLPYLVVDGTYITQSNITFNTSLPHAKVNILAGMLHDDMAGLISYPNTTNISQAIEAIGYNAAVVLDNPSLFPEPTGSNATTNIFNVTSHLSTDYGFRCVNHAYAVSAVSDGFFESYWFYQFERSYQYIEFDPNAPVCQAPVDQEHPYGDTSLPYFRCHGGDILYSFGNIEFVGVPLRDNIDLPFEQYILDLWASFTRTSNPNPTSDYLSARGYTSTLDQVTASGGTWQSVTSSSATLRSLDWPSSQIAFDEASQCDVLDIPLDYFS